MPEISVIMPVYNVDKYLAQGLNSMLAQTYRDFELICVNDGSTDNSAQILAEYAKKDNRIKIISQPNQGLSVARNEGLKYASGKYIYFMDSDDTIHPELLEIAHDFAIRFNADLVSFGFEEVRGKDVLPATIDKDKIKYKQSNNPLFLGTTKEKYRINYNVWTKLYRKELLEGINFIPHIKFEDYPHTFAILAKKPNTIILNQKLYFYRIIENSLSRQRASTQQIKDYQTGIDFVYDIYSSPALKKELAFLKRTFIPNILKHQLGRCRRADKDIRSQMYAVFAEELRELDKKGLISWRGHKLSRYFAIRKLIKKGTL